MITTIELPTPEEADLLIASCERVIHTRKYNPQSLEEISKRILHKDGSVNVYRFALEYKLAETTVARHMRQGFCKWAHKKDTNKSAHPMYNYWHRNIDGKTSVVAIGLKGETVRLPIHLAWATSLNRFINMVGVRPSRNHRLTRTDTNLGFIPGNVRWRKVHNRQRINKLGGSIYDIRCLQL